MFAGVVVLLVSLTLSQSRGTAIALAVSTLVWVVPRVRVRRSTMVDRSLILVGLATGAVMLALSFQHGAPDQGRLTTQSAISERVTGVGVGPGGTPHISRDPPAPGGAGRSSNLRQRRVEKDVSSGRFAIYARLLDAYQQKPILGTGYRTSELLPGMRGLSGHDIYLSVLVELGVVGGALFFLFVLSLLRAAFSGRSYRLAASALVGASIVGVSEITESSILGWGSPTTLVAWLLIFAALRPAWLLREG